MSIFYKIISPTGKINYLFGTAHTNKPEFITLPLEVKEALDKATTCMFEGDFDEGHKARGLINKNLNSLRQDLYKVAENDLKIAEMWLENNYNAIPYSVAASLMEKGEPIDPSEYENVLDNQLKNYSKRTNKALVFFESMEDLINSMYGFHLSLQEKIQFYHFMKSERARKGKFMSATEIKKAYQLQDIAVLKYGVNPYPPTADIPEPVRRYYDELTVVRELKMVEAMEPHLNQGDTFIAVGAGHLEGIINQLQSKNYTVEAVPLGKRYYPIDGSLEDGEKVAAFRKIYTALYTAQTTYFKIRGFIPDEEITVSLAQVRDYTYENANTRSAKAWELAQLHYKNISSSNTELLKAICREGYGKSSLLGIFKRTRTNLDDAREVAEASSNTRTGAVRDVLNGPSI